MGLYACNHSSHSKIMAESTDENRCVKLLLSISSESLFSPLSRIVSDNSSEIACGWKLARGCPEYNCIPKTKTRKPCKDMSSSPSKQLLCRSSSTAVIDSSSNKMGGRLTENLDYVYCGGLSSRVRGIESPVIPPFTHHQRQSLNHSLNSILEYRSEAMPEATRRDLSRLVQLQMTPDITYEQMIIEQRLRSMDLNMLSITGFNKHNKHKQPSLCTVQPIKPVVMHVQSISEPPITHPNNIHVKQSTSNKSRKRRRLRPVKWCTLANQPPAFAKQPENIVYDRSRFS